MIKVLHHNDADGYAAGYLVKRANSYTEVETTPVDYSTNLDSFIANLNKEDIVNILDFSVEPEVLESIAERAHMVVWIDHHKSAIEKYEGVEIPENVDTFLKVGFCGAALTWLYVNSNVSFSYDLKELHSTFDTEVPYWLRLVNDWDVWEHKLPETKPFMTKVNTILSIETFEKLDEDYRIAKSAGSKQGVYLLSLIQEGKAYILYRDIWAKQFSERYGFETLIEDENKKLLKTFCLNLGNANSEYFGDKIDEYDICLTYAFNGKIWNYSIYSNKSYVDCSTIARNLGGGGHKGASGFSTDYPIDATPLMWNDTKLFKK